MTASGQPLSWRRFPGVLAWPQGWQRPARTEEWAFEACASALGPLPFAQLVCFPWASLVDYLDRGHIGRAAPFLEALASAPPGATLVRATVCQHIRADALLPWMKTLRITDLFWSHARTDQTELDGIRVHPFPLYPVRALDRREPLAGADRAPARRRLLYSFVGAYSPEGYLTPTRRWIAELPPRDDALVALRDTWHYESAVYGEQVAQRPTPLEVLDRVKRNADEYDAVLLESVFSLCPSGSGPNSIRLWESLGFGCIPVLLSDRLRLPGTDEEWSEAIVQVPETPDAIAALPCRLEEMRRDPERLARMQSAGRRLWHRYGRSGPGTILRTLADARWVRAQITSGETGRTGV